MNAIEQLTRQHRHCDTSLVQAERAVRQGDWLAANQAFQRFEHDMLAHFALEEEQLFPAFETATGMSMGPTVVMRNEHAEMRETFLDLRDALQAESGADYLGHSETLLILMQQHNMKEENILYPMCAQHVADVDALVSRASAA
ncbi:hemerythrin domain-containing protein [Paludibacterium yongneupense]|uniref:hemerythrin domain-containing protein n=1 Tax=Paludibacterium yongneupense TaxID=400061 RepID=UPI0003FE283D|nr:hemerythrin domain-containing protein [Paludibacterium yongneupense]